MESLKDILSRIGARHGVDQLNPMQKAALAAKSDRVILLAPTGSGKTLAFAIPMLNRLGTEGQGVQAVVLAPSRELVLQIADVIRPIADGYRTLALYGGHDMTDETNSLKVTPDIVIATPGRLLDHLNRDNIDISRTPSLVIDEYDKALELGFHDQMRRIVRRMRSLRYVMLTSATPLTEKCDFIDLSQAKTIDFSVKTEAPRSRMRVALVRSDNRDKLEALGNLLWSLPNGRVIVFVNHRESAERVYNYLKGAGMPVGLYHGGLDQQKRELAVDLINNGTTPVLVSTDLGSRGLDIEAVQAVVHYHMPPTPESWTHRNGRTARVDAVGNVYILASEGEDLPEYVDYDYEYVPDPDTNPDPIVSSTATVYFNAGKKEKLSKGDILGFLTKQVGLAGSEVGRIVVKDHYAIAAVPLLRQADVLQTADNTKIKGHRIRVTALM